MHSAALYIAPNQACVARAAKGLALAGLPSGDLSVLGADGRVYGTRALKGAAVCAVLGGVLGATLAWAFDLRGATFHAGPLRDLGSSFALVIGFAVGAAAGSLTGSLIGLGIPFSRAQRSLRRGGKGSVLVSVQANDANGDVARSVPISASIDEHGDALVAEAEKLPDYRIEVAPQSGPHRRSSGRWHRFVFSYADPERAGHAEHVGDAQRLQRRKHRHPGIDAGGTHSCAPPRARPATRARPCLLRPADRATVRPSA